MRILLIYVNEKDFEANSESKDWNSLIATFDKVFLFVFVEVSTAKDIESLVPKEQYTKTLITGDEIEIKTALVNTLEENLHSNLERYLQFVSHGAKEGLAIKMMNSINGRLQTLISYKDLALMLSKHKNIFLNLMTVCDSDQPELIAVRLSLLATSTGDSGTDESITDSFSVIKSINEEVSIKTVFFEELKDSINQYNLYSDGEQVS